MIKINGKEIGQFADLIAYLFTQTSPGDTVTFTVIRNNEEITVDLVLGRRPQSQ